MYQVKKNTNVTITLNSSLFKHTCSHTYAFFWSDVIESLRSNRAHPSQTDITGSGADLFVRALDRLLGPLMIIKEELDIQEEIGRGKRL